MQTVISKESEILWENQLTKDKREHICNGKVEQVEICGAPHVVCFTYHKTCAEITCESIVSLNNSQITKNKVEQT